MFSTSVLDVPRPLIDPVSSLVEALSVATLALRRPRRPDTIVLGLDTQRRGVHLFRTQPLQHTTCHHIVRECSHHSAIHSVVIFSIRPTTPVCLADTTMLHSMTRTLTAAGIHLFDWMVIGSGGVYCPRSLTGAADPWPQGSACL